MTAPVRRKTARERDRELIAAAAPWRGTVMQNGLGYLVLGLTRNPESKVPLATAASALLRETERIAREVRKEKRRGR